MIILDENIPDEQADLLEKRRIHVRRIGREVGWFGMDDEEIIPLLHQLQRPTFFTLDSDYYKRRLRHKGYCLVHLVVEDEMIAGYIQALLRQSAFNTRAKRMGCVIQVQPSGIALWRMNVQTELDMEWS
jgi:hypothetical protein